MAIVNLLSRAFARSVSDVEGMRSVGLPLGIADESNALDDLVRHANDLEIEKSSGKSRNDPDYAPFAVLYLERPRDVHPEVTACRSQNEVVSFRGKKRIVVGSSAEIATLIGASNPIVGRNYPSGQGQNNILSLERLASSALIELQSAADLDVSAAYSQKCVVALTNIFRILSDTHENLSTELVIDWNAVWFDHVNIGLNRVLDSLLRIKDNLDLESFLSEHLYAAFSLPSPKAGIDKKYSKAHQKKTAISDALKMFWGNSNEVLISIALLKNYPEYAPLAPNNEHPISNIDWSNYDETLLSPATKGSAPLAWATHEGNANGRIQYFSKLTEDQFFNPRLIKKGVLQIIDPEESELVHQLFGSNLHIISGTTFDSTNGRLVSPRVQVIVPLEPQQQISSTEVTTSDLKLLVRNKGNFEGVLGLSQELQFDGLLGLDVKQTAGGYIFTPKPNLLSLKVDPTDPLIGKVDLSATAAFIFVPSNAVGAFIFEVNTTGVGAPTVVVQEGQENQEIAVKTNGTFQVVLFSPNENAPVFLNNKKVQNVDGSRFLWETDQFVASGMDQISIDGFEIRLTSEVNAVSAPESPILAAILKVSHSKDQPKIAHRDSLRGDLEGYYAQLVDSVGWHSTMGHIVLPSDRLGEIDEIEITTQEADFGMSSEMAEVWQQVIQGRVSKALKESAEAEEFRLAFEGLNIKSRLTQTDADNGESLTWVSKTSWKHLVDDPTQLDRYLRAYSQLVEKANALGDEKGRIWATYPFSLSIWRTYGAPRLQAVLLSPLHPIRLAWIAHMEGSLRQARNAPDLCGAIEGWNLPFIGPSGTSNGKLLAVPCDSGSDQLFLGWSLMVDVSVDGPDVVKPPVFAGSHRLPGISNSGLNANTVKDALRDFRRLHPYVSTLTVDLAARSETPKLVEMDEAVIGECSQWAIQERLGKGLVGGVRVFDSLNREGSRPEFLDSGDLGLGSSPITWKRYKDEPMKPIEANIRILQDSGIAMVVNQNQNFAHGVIGTIPFRRFEIPDDLVAVNSQEVRYMPTLPNAEDRGSFHDALRAIENPREADPWIGLRIQGNSPLLGAAEWTISGESMISPSALAALLNNNFSTSQMLWEWHPPFLGNGKSKDIGSVLDRRPYFTLARIPQILQSRLKEKLSFLLGRAATKDDAENVFKVLGARGIGLSALVAAGGSQLTGALGFYSVFSFDGLADAGKRNRFIMPIDVCNQFLTDLAGGIDSGQDKKRADLLVIEVTSDSVCLTPVEIKFYGTENVNDLAAELPEVGSVALLDAVSQAENSLKLLRRIQQHWGRSKDDPALKYDHLLKSNALATFIESAMRINPQCVDANLAVRSLQSVVDGTTKIRLGRPLVVFFKPTDSPIRINVGLDVPSSGGGGVHAEFICDPRSALQQLAVGDGNILQEWSRALDWSLKCEDPVDGPDIGAPDETDYTNEPIHVIDVVEDLKPRLEPEEREIEVSDLPEVEPVVVPIHVNSIVGEGVKFEVGILTNTAPPVSAVFWPSNTALNQLNIGVVGDLGTGKTQLVKALIWQLRVKTQQVQPSPLTALILDYKHDYQDAAFLDAVNGKVLKPHKIPLDIFRVIGENSIPNRFMRTNAFIDVLKKIYAGIGPRQRGKLQKVIMDLYAASDNAPTLKEVAVAYSAAVPAGDAVVAILNNFVLGEVFSSDRSELKTLSELIDDSVLILDIDAFGADQQSKNALVALFLNQYYEYMIQLQKWPFEKTENVQLRRLNSYLVVDEATNIMEYSFEVLMRLLLQGREYGVGVLLSSQYLSHFSPSGGDNYGQPLLTWFIHKIPDVVLGQLHSLGLPTANAGDVTRIKTNPNHVAYYSSLNFAGKFIRGNGFWERKQD